MFGIPKKECAACGRQLTVFEEKEVVDGKTCCKECAYIIIKKKRNDFVSRNL